MESATAAAPQATVSTHAKSHVTPPRGLLARNRALVESVIDFTGGVAGGVATVYVGQPLDTVKVKMQTFPGLYRGPAHCLVQTYRDIGVSRGLYAGTVPSLLSNVGENAILFVAYGLCQKAVASLVGKPTIEQLSPVQNALAGSCSAFFSALFVSPTEMIKCRMQALIEMRQAGKLTGPLAANSVGTWTMTRHILRQEGLPGLFHGLQATWIREMPGYFCFFGGYELCRVLCTPAGKTKEELGVIPLLLCGGVGGVSFWVSVFPMDVIKSRMQVHTGSELTTKPSYGDIIRSIRHEGGFRGFYNGLLPTVIRSFCATAALFVAYEHTKKILTRAAFSDDDSNSS